MKRAAESILIVYVLLYVISSYQLRFDLIYQVNEGAYASDIERPFAGNLTYGDIGAIFALALIFSSEFRQALRRTISRPYWMLAGIFCLSCVGFSAFTQSQALHLKQTVQYGFCLLVVVPTTATLFALCENKRRLVVFFGWLFVALFSVGSLLRLYWGSDLIIRLYGIRWFPNLNYEVLQYSALAGGLCLLAQEKPRFVSGCILYSSFLVALILESSRTGFVLLLVAVPTAFIAATKKRRASMILVCAVGMILATVAIFRAESDMLFVRSEGFSDEERVGLVRDGWRTLLAKPTAFVTGNGWDSSGVHNVTIQTFVDAGIVAATAITVLCLLPAIGLVRSYKNYGARRFAELLPGTVIYFAILVHISLNALPALRPYWIAFGIGFGSLSRLRINRDWPGTNALSLGRPPKR